MEGEVFLFPSGKRKCGELKPSGLRSCQPVEGSLSLALNRSEC